MNQKLFDSPSVQEPTLVEKNHSRLNYSLKGFDLGEEAGP